MKDSFNVNFRNRSIENLSATGEKAPKLIVAKKSNIVAFSKIRPNKN